MNELTCTRTKLLREIQIATFEAVEVNLYLDTHPYDNDALEALTKYENKRNKLISEYETNYGPILAYGSVGSDCKAYKWALEAFPWELED